LIRVYASPYSNRYGIPNLFRLALFLTVLVIIPSSLGAQSDIADLRFERIGVDDGLINSNVSAIIQDKRGFIWFGTIAGLNRYDGYEFREYRYEPFDTGSLPHSQIQTMYMDSEGYIWIGTYGGLSRLDPATETFTNFLSDPDEPDTLSDPLVMSVLVDSSDRLWVGTNDGISMSQNGGAAFTRFASDPEEPRSLADKTIRALLEDRLGRIWVGHYDGVSWYDEERGDFTNIRRSDSEGGLPGTFVLSMAEDSRGRVFVGMWEGFISRWDEPEQRFTSWRIPTEGVYQLMFDSDDTLWIATWTGGLFAMDPDSGEYRRYEQEAGNDSSLSNNLVYSLMEDAGGILWVGTRGGGINKYDPKKNSFEVYQAEEGSNSISPGDYNVLLEDSRGNLWLGTYTNGLDLIDRESGTVTHHRFDPGDPRSINDDYVRHVYEDLRGQLWILTNSGLNRYDYDREDFIRYGDPFAERIMNSMIQDRDGNYWFGTYNNGIIYTDSSFEEYRFYRHDKNDARSISNNLISVIFQDSAGDIWFGTNGGLDRRTGDGFEHFRYDPEDLRSISGNKISTIVEDDFRQLWIGTNSGGLNLYDRESREFIHFTTRNGLPSNYIAAVVPDEQQRMWISTSRGLVILDPDLKDFIILDEDDGLVSWEMNPAATRTRDGTLFISSDAGIHRIADISYVNNNNKPPVVITRVTISGENFPIAVEQDLLLNFQQNFLSFDFAALDFTAPSKNSFQYRLLGLDSEWSQPGRENRAVYSELSPGRYVFEVRGANNDGIWGDGVARYSFTIQPPWYLSPPAVALSLIFLMIFLFTAFNFFRIRWQLKQQELEEETRINRLLERKVMERTRALSEARQRAEAADVAKSQFLANISHDIRTPLNSIIGFSELFRRRPDSDQSRKYIDTIYTESKKLLELINEILDMSKIEAGKYHSIASSFDLNRFIREQTSSYRETAMGKGLDFTLEIDEKLPRYIISDRLSLSRILENLLSNALKFTPTGQIKLIVSLINTAHRQNRIRFSVEDTGIGIPEEKQNIIFQSFEQIDKSLNRTYSGSGLGMSIAAQLVSHLGGDGITVRSTPGSGSTFTFEIPLNAGSSKTEDLLADDEPVRYDFSGIQILMVEDYEPNQEIIRALLAESGATIIPASSGEEAVNLAGKGQFALVIMDLHMPGMDGLEATAAIRRFDADVPILGVTADVVEESRTSCLEAGMNEVIHKPVRQKILLDAIQQLVFPGRAVPDTKPKEERNQDQVFDIEGLLLEHDGQRDIVFALAEGFIVAARDSCARIVKCIQKGEIQECHRLCHSIKGGALNLMAFDLARSAEHMEGRLKALMEAGAALGLGEAGEFRTMHKELEMKIDALEKQLQAAETPDGQADH
jgi:signal transduction histidine kinase/ligand-binding sensor domain-containing protein/CheY-like chemotaxis protein/HPt (histidine-containing phosphotransfer) domain-containing protein